MNIPLWLPPDAQAQQRSAALREKIIAAMPEDGLSFADFMNMALYDPEFGYYHNLQSIGEEGDFVTAPELTPFFAATLAAFAARLSVIHGWPLHFYEFGAGTGALAKGILDYCQAQHLDCSYHILDLSASLKQQQQFWLQPFRDQVTWYSQWPTAIQGFVIANELLDALPIRAFARHQTQNDFILERRVVRDAAGALTFQGIFKPELQEKVLALETDLGRRLTSPVADWFLGEISDWIPAWLQMLARHWQQGAVFIIDYGELAADLYAPARALGTLRAHYRQVAHDDLFYYPGLQDLTAQVNFSQVQQQAEVLGWQPYFYDTQANFLLKHGITEQVAAAWPTLSAIQQYQAATALKKLTFPNEMGEKFKVLVALK
jgi:SAM-dependent MidA family methyltransferase